MKSTAQKLTWPLVIGLVLIVFTLGALFFLSRLKPSSAAASPLPVYGKVVDFTLTNQLGAPVSLADLHGKVWIADIIFTRCPGPCARMTRQMKELETQLGPDSRVQLVSLTTDPEFDSPEVLSQYAERFNADTNRWMFLTGSKPQIAAAAIDGLKLAAVEKKPEERESEDDLFIHSTIFVIVDKAGKLRGVFETGGDGVDWNESREKLLNAAKELEREK